MYNTTVLTNEPAFPDMLAWAEAYGAYNFSAVPGIAGAREAGWREGGGEEGHRGLFVRSDSNFISFAPPPMRAAATPWVKPDVIPFNSANDAADTGYFGSQSRFMRLSLQQQDCSEWAW